MKKYLYSFITLLTAVFALSSCEDVPAPYDLPGPGGSTEPVTGENLLINGDFETWADGLPTNWKSASTASNAVLSQSTDAHGGSYSVKLGNPGTANKRLAYKEITLKAGTYEFCFYAKSTTPDASQTRPGYVPVINGSVGDYAYGGYTTINNTAWTQVSHTFTLDAETTVCLVVMNPKGSDYAVAQEILIDDASLKTNDGGVVDGGGTTTPDTPNTPASGTELSVAEALALINGMEPAAQTSEQYIVSGKVVEVTEISAQYGNATVVLDDGFTLFRFKGFNGENFTDVNAIKVGDNIKVKGNLKKYVKDDVITPELVNGTMVELNGTTAAEGNDNPGTGGGEVSGNSITVTASSFGLDNGTAVGTQTLSDGTVLTFDGGGNSNDPKYYNAGTNIRMYPKNTMKVTAKKKIASIILNCDTYQGTICNASGDIAAAPGSVKVNNEVVTITVGANETTVSNTSGQTGAASQIRVVSLTINYAE